MPARSRGDPRREGSSRVGLIRAFIAVLWAGLLLVPVGVQTASGPVPASVGEALGELARGRLGVGILSALVAGGDLLGPAIVRLVLIAVASIAFWLTGKLSDEPVSDAPVGRRRCPHCQSWMSTAMQDCPSCGRPVARRLEDQ